jgi:hypothetical protein
MADENGAVHDPAVTYVTDTPPDQADQNTLWARAYHPPGEKYFIKGNPGRPPGIKDKRSKSAQEILDAYGHEPLVEKMEQLLRLKAKLARGIWRSDDEEMRCEELLHKITADIMQYRHQRLKTVESHTQIAIVQKLQALNGMSDAELDALYLEAQELAKQLPPGGS